MQRQVDAFYGLFLDRVAEGRRLPRSEVEAVAAGRVWTGRQALEHRLVDRLGTLADAVAVARDAAGLGAGDGVVVRRAGAGAAGRLSLAALQGVAQGSALDRLCARGARAAGAPPARRRRPGTAPGLARGLDRRRARRADSRPHRRAFGPTRVAVILSLRSSFFARDRVVSTPVST